MGRDAVKLRYYGGDMIDRNQSINVFKGIACELVVLNHYYGTGILGNIEYNISHIGVPFFFLVAGFYLYDYQGELSIKRLLKKAGHICCLLVVHFSLYFIDNCFQKYVLNGNEMTWKALLHDLGGVLSTSVLKSMVLWSTSIMGTGQWFLIALIEAYLFFGLLIFLRTEKRIFRHGYAIAAVLFVVHIPVRMILIKSGLMSVGEMPLTASAAVRNVWFYALPFMFIGISIRKKGLKICNPRQCIYIGLIAVAISIVESFLTIQIMLPESVSCVLYLGTIVAAVSFFIYCVNLPQGMKNQFLKYIGDKLSMIIFFIHPLVGFYILRIGLWDNLVLRNLLPIIVMIITTTISYAIYNMWAKIKSLKCKIFY